MEKSSLQKPVTSFDDIHKQIHTYIKMRDISIPITIENIPHGINIYFTFTDTVLNYKTTNLKSAYKDSIIFIEEMDAEFNTPPSRQYIHKTGNTNGYK